MNNDLEYWRNIIACPKCGRDQLRKACYQPDGKLSSATNLQVDCPACGWKWPPATQPYRGGEMSEKPKLVWKNIETGELTDGAVPFLPVTRAVWAIVLDGKLMELCEEAASKLHPTS